MHHRVFSTWPAILRFYSRVWRRGLSSLPELLSVRRHRRNFSKVEPDAIIAPHSRKIMGVERMTINFVLDARGPEVRRTLRSRRGFPARAWSDFRRRGYIRTGSPL